MSKLYKVLRDEEGASMVEYGLLVALIAVFLIVAVKFLAGGINTVFNTAGTEMNAAAGGGT